MKTRTHIAKLSKRTGSCRVTEKKDRIIVDLVFDRYGDFGDLAEVNAWLSELFAPYDRDARPVFMQHPLTKELAVIQ
jgi:hypothetical protein